jgi:hypothetical protein
MYNFSTLFLGTSYPKKILGVGKLPEELECGSASTNQNTLGIHMSVQQAMKEP